MNRARLPWIHAATAGLLVAASVCLPAPAAAIGADAVVLVNSTSPAYPDFQHHLQPYLDNFGVPYTVLDISSNAVDTNISRYSVIIVGHGQLDTNGVFLGTNAQRSLTLAITNGTGLVSFDGALASNGGTPRYSFIQAIFGFSYGSAVSGTSVSLPATEPGSQMHFITARHSAGDSVSLRASMSVPGLTAPSNVTAVALSGGKPLVAVTKFGQGRAVQWSSYDWMAISILGPIEGLDDVVWRGIVWAARKPFVMRGLPNFVTMRVDDVSGPLWWAHTVTDAGFRPFLSVFLSNITDAATLDLQGLVTNGLATTSIHSWNCCNTFFYFNYGSGVSYSDSVMSNNVYLGGQWHTNHAIPISKIAVAHYSEMGPNAFAGLKTWGVEYVTLKNYPGTVRDSPWLVLGPYRLYEPQQLGSISLPVFYADFLSVPGHPEFNGQFFNCVTEIRDDPSSSCAEWCPANSDVSGTIGRGTRQIKRALDSLVLPTLFFHEWWVIPIPQSANQTPITTNNWFTMVQGLTNNLASYNPLYVTMDYAYQYVRATRTSRLLSSAYDPASGQVTANFSGTTDLDTLAYVYTGDDNVITNVAGTVPAFSQPQTVPIALLEPPSLSVARTQTNSVILTWPGPASGFVLQQNPLLGGTNWSALSNIPSVQGLQLQVVLPDPTTNSFFRLSKP
ncbi:MAG TPA: hypothetical protein VN578_04725 [Candidatus Binatia bacterium]|nr:hypothetical protein [Candidatus Binatia bacterium]